MDSEDWLLSVLQTHARPAARTKEAAALTVQAEQVEVVVAPAVVVQVLDQSSTSRLDALMVVVVEVVVVALAAVVAREEVPDPATAAAMIASIAVEKVQDAHAPNLQDAQPLHSCNAQTQDAAAVVVILALAAAEIL